MLDPSHLLDKLSCFRSNDDPFPALQSPLYQPKPPVPLMGFESNLFLPVIVESSLQRQQQEEEEEEVVIATTTTTTKKKNSSNPRRRKPIKNDRHSKIYTAQGLRDRRMRLSLEVARKFFALQDMLGFDKASTTVDWLITQSKSSIEQHVVNLSKGSSSSPMDRFSVKKAKEEGKKVGSSSSSSSSSRRKVSLQQLLSKGARAEARARARERTKEKKKEKEKDKDKEKENFGGQSEEYYLYDELLPFVISGESSNQNIYNNNYLIGCSSDDSLNIFQEQMNINGEFSGEFDN